MLRSPDRRDRMSELSTTVRPSSKTGTALGIVTILLGFLAMSVPLVSGLAVAAVVGVLLIGGGIARALFAFRLAPLERDC